MAAVSAAQNSSMPRYASLGALTGLRGVLALWIVGLHIQVGLRFSGFPLEEKLPDYWVRVIGSGSVAVSIFFMLSGFILSHVYTHTLGHRWSWRHAFSFWGLRLARIYPVHLAVLFGYIAFKLGGGTFLVEHSCGDPQSPLTCDRFAMGELWKHLLLVSSWGWNPQISWNTVSWSVSSEWFAYLWFPVLIMLLTKITRGSIAFFSAVIFMGLALALLYIANPLVTEPVLTPNRAPDSKGLVMLIGGFLCGALLYRSYLSPLYHRIHWATIGWTSLLLIMLLLATDWVLLTLPLWGIMLLVLAQPNGRISSFLSSYFMQWLGRISYSLYMVHLLIMELFGVIFKDPNATPISQLGITEVIGLSILLVTACLVAATVLYYGVEEPCRKRIRRAIVRGGGLAD